MEKQTVVVQSRCGVICYGVVMVTLAHYNTRSTQDCAGTALSPLPTRRRHELRRVVGGDNGRRTGDGRGD